MNCPVALLDGTTSEGSNRVAIIIELCDGSLLRCRTRPEKKQAAQGEDRAAWLAKSSGEEGKLEAMPQCYERHPRA